MKAERRIPFGKWKNARLSDQAMQAVNVMADTLLEAVGGQP
jgi:hypothetical protein